MIILNEKKYVEALLEEPFLEKKAGEELFRIAKYYRRTHSQKELYGLLEEFLLRCDKTINLFRWSQTIEWAIKASKNRPLIEVDRIPITQKEFDDCMGFSVPLDGKTLFALICIAKYRLAANEKNEGWVNTKDSEIFSMVGGVYTVRSRAMVLNRLKTSGKIAFSNKLENTNIRVLCIDKDGEPAFYVDDFRNLGNQLMAHAGDPYVKCDMCGRVVRRTNRKQRYCKDCAKKRNSQKTYLNRISAGSF